MEVEIEFHVAGKLKARRSKVSRRDRSEESGVAARRWLSHSRLRWGVVRPTFCRVCNYLPFYRTSPPSYRLMTEPRVWTTCSRSLHEGETVGSPRPLDRQFFTFPTSA